MGLAFLVKFLELCIIAAVNCTYPAAAHDPDEEQRRTGQPNWS